MCETLESGTDDVERMREGNGGESGNCAGGDVLPFPIRRSIRRHCKKFFQVLMFLLFNKSGNGWVQNDVGFWRSKELKTAYVNWFTCGGSNINKNCFLFVGVIVRSIILEERSQDCEYKGWLNDVATIMMFRLNFNVLTPICIKLF